MSPDGSSIVFERSPRTLDRQRLRAFSKKLCAEVAAGRQFTCLLTHDARLQSLNREFLHQDYPTDVLSFPSGDDASLGEMAISMERASEQAAAFEHAVETEIEVLMLHGVLHLMGMDHETDKGRMARAEAAWRKKLGLPAGLIARARKKR